VAASISTSGASRGARVVLFVIVALALAIRVGWVLRLPTSDEYLANLPDQLEYLQLGRSLIERSELVFYSEPFQDELRAYRTPGYPLVVAALRGNVRAVRLAQALIDASTVLAVYLLARRWLAPGTSVLAGALVALNPFLIYFCGLILSETLFTSMLAWGMALIVAPFPKRWGALAWWVGAIELALSVLVRPSALLLPIVLAIGGAVANRRAGGPYLSRWAPPVATTVLLIQMAVLAPWCYRNWRVLGSWVMTTTNAGVTLYDGLNPDATGASDQRFLRSMPQLKRMTEVQRSEYLSNLAWQYARQHPRRALELAARKVARTWSPVPLSSDYGSRRNVIIGALYVIPLMLLVVLGLWRGPLPASAKVFCLLPAIYFTGAHAVSVGSLRYRLPADVPMAVVAASAGGALINARGKAPAGASAHG
jgi:4-amino-4-deoxy-L-arabinose transferase-like glycosyltransferase